MFDQVNAGQSIDKFLNTIQADYQAWIDAVSALVDCAIALRETGITFKTDDADIDDFLSSTRATMLTKISAALRCNSPDAGWLTTSLVCAVSQHRNGRKINCTQETPAPAPMQVEIVAMPTRETTSAVSYDKNGDIKSTTQTEKDAD